MHVSRLASPLSAVLVAIAIGAGLPDRAGAQEATGQPYLAPGITESLITEPADKARYDRLAHELRCLVCQNQTLAESDASLAADLRRQVESMIIDGQSDDQIKGFLVQRYGDFVLYRPPVQSNTWFLWFGPFLLLAIGVAVWLGINRRRSRLLDTTSRAGARQGADSADQAGAGAATAADIERVRRLLDGS